MFTTTNWKEDPKFAGQRKKLVAELRSKGISSELVLKAIGALPRQNFFPKDFEQFVYRDAAFPIGLGQTISQPLTVAFQTQLLQVRENMKVLEIGTGSGYQCAVLAMLGANVYSIEILKGLLTTAVKVLKNLDIPAQVFLGDGTLGLPAQAPFDRILVTAGAPNVPQTYIQQLKVGGILVIPVGDSEKDQKMLRIIKTAENETRTEVFGNFQFVPLKGVNGWQ